MKLISWNVNGLRAVAKKNFFDDFEAINADVFCIQETKAQDDQVAEVLSGLSGYHFYSNSAERLGYSGTAMITKTAPEEVFYDMGHPEHDREGRVITADFGGFFLVTVYVPNSGNDLRRLDYRQTWDLAFFNYLNHLEETKPVMVCGDFNVAHKEIDLARPKANYNKSAGFMQEEIDGMNRYTNGGLIDTFRHFYPDLRDSYSWWSYRAGARQKNVGWRIDYFLASAHILTSVKEAFILNEIVGSDHCPVGLELY